ncbi:MAG: 3-isopropylmalate dehydrogenase [Spirochaetes bacterium]|nr:3-isopropylmalate dehydrogenase [Spirochaetota bacterium]
MTKNIAVLTGDGIGPEIMAEALKVLHAVGKKYGHIFNCEEAPFGASAYFSHGNPFPKEAQDVCDRADAIMKGPVGLAVNEMNRIPQEMRPEIGAILPLRKRYNTFANYRPVRLPASLASLSPLKPEIIGKGIDILMIRELVGGLYFGDKVEGTATGMKYSSDELIYTADEVRDIARVAFNEARKGKVKLTNVHKANVLATSRFWNAIVDTVRAEYTDVVYESVLVDNAAYQLVKNPAQYNGVMLFENMQGDILTDQAGGILGSLGLMPSACVGPAKTYVEPAHGSAPDIAGKNIANPYSMIGSVALMLEKAFGLDREANAVWNALTRVLTDGYRTVELTDASTKKEYILGTKEFGDRVRDIVAE